MPTAVLDLPCDVCACVRAFAQPECGEAHAGDCPEWFCLGCGSAILIDPPRAATTPDQGHQAAA